MSVVYRKDGGYESSGGSGGSTVAGSTQVSISQLLDSSGGSVPAGDSANNAIRVNVVAGAAAGSTLVTVRQSTVGDFRAAVYQSTAADLNVTVAGYVAPSTTVTLSRVLDSSGGGVVVGDSANSALRVNVVAGAAGGSTVVTVARMVGNSSAVDYMPVRVVDSSGTGFMQPGVDYTDGSTASVFTAPGLAFRNSSNDTMRLVGSSTPLPVTVGVVETRELPGSTVAYGQVALSTTATQIVAASTARTRLIIVQHSSAIPVFLGASTVTSTSGVLLYHVPGNQFLVKHSNAVYGTSTGGSPVVSFMQETRG